MPGAKPPAGLTGPVLGERLENILNGHRLLVLVLFSAVYFPGILRESNRKLAWLDEVVFISIARLPTLHDIWSALTAGVNIDPPLVHTLVHFLFSIFGPSLTAARLPSIFGFWVMCLCLFALVASRAGYIYACAAMALPFSTLVWEMAIEARPYALMLGSSALALVFWDRVKHGRSKHYIGVTLCLAIALCCHFYAILIFFPLLVAEFAGWIATKKVDWKMIVSIWAAAVPLPLWLPIVSASRQFTSGYFARVRFALLPAYFEANYFILGVVAALLLLWLLLTTPRLRVKSEPANAQFDPFWVMLAGLLVLPFVAFLLGLAVTRVFAPRYLVQSTLGYFIAIPLLFRKVSRGNRFFDVALLATVVPLAFATRPMFNSGLTPTRAEIAETAAIASRVTGDIVWESPLTYLSTDFYSTEDVRRRLVYPYAPELELRYSREHFDTTDRIYQLLAPRTDARLVPFSIFVENHRTFFMICSSPEKPPERPHGAWLLTYLTGIGARIEEAGGTSVRLVRVTLP
jgi:hypothetical protein